MKRTVRIGSFWVKAIEVPEPGESLMNIQAKLVVGKTSGRRTKALAWDVELTGSLIVWHPVLNYTTMFDSRLLETEFDTVDDKPQPFLPTLDYVHLDLSFAAPMAEMLGGGGHVIQTLAGQSSVKVHPNGELNLHRTVWRDLNDPAGKVWVIQDEYVGEGSWCGWVGHMEQGKILHPHLGPLKLGNPLCYSDLALNWDWEQFMSITPDSHLICIYQPYREPTARGNAPQSRRETMKAKDKLRAKRERALNQINARVEFWKRKIQDLHPMAPAVWYQTQLRQVEAERAVVQARIESGEGKASKRTPAEVSWQRRIRANYAEQEARRWNDLLQSTVDLA